MDWRGGQVFSVDIEAAAFISWDLGRSEMVVRRWTPGAGASETRRTYR